MFGQYCIYSFAICVLFDEASNAHPLIGKNVELAGNSEFPFIVSLSKTCNVIDKENHFCGGSLISRKHVLTAAHCLSSDKSCVTIIAGTADFKSGQIYGIDEWIKYDDWVIGNNWLPQYNDNDIAIITLSQDVKGIVPGVISKLKMSEVIEERRVVTAGWGVTNRSTFTDPESLRKANLQILTREEYELSERVLFGDVDPMPPNKYFTFSIPQAVVTHGDSGSPLMLGPNKEIVGVNEAGCSIPEPENNPYAYSVHIAVDRYRDFIDSVIKSEKSQTCR